MQTLTAERKKIDEEAKKEPDRAALAQAIADRMTDDVMSMNAFVQIAKKMGLFGNIKEGQKAQARGKAR
jgi:hypothetical protein